jgi:hypothetical protein
MRKQRYFWKQYRFKKQSNLLNYYSKLYKSIKIFQEILIGLIQKNTPIESRLSPEPSHPSRLHSRTRAPKPR